MRAGPLNLADLDKAYLVIVQLKTQPPGVIHQVTLRPDKVKTDYQPCPCGHGKLQRSVIRFGETPGDEAAGWQSPHNVEIISVLGVAVEVGDKWECQPIPERYSWRNGQNVRKDLDDAFTRETGEDPWRGGQCA